MIESNSLSTVVADQKEQLLSPRSQNPLAIDTEQIKKEQDDEFIAAETEKERIAKMSFYKRVFAKYDRSFLLVYSIQYANASCKFLQLLAVQVLFKSYYNLEPADSQFYITFMWIPWQLKFICGIVSDSVPIMGSRKKSWLVVWGALQIIASLTVAFVEIESVKLLTFLCSVTSCAGCFMDVIVDSLMVIQARRDPIQCSQELQAFSWQVQAVFAVLNGLAGAFMTGFLTPYWCFGICAIFGAVCFVTAFYLKSQVEFESDIATGLAFVNEDGSV